MLNNVINMVMNGAMKNNPLMAQFNQLMGGKDTTQQWQTLMNIAQNKGIDINQKILSKADLIKLGINIP